MTDCKSAALKLLDEHASTIPDDRTVAILHALITYAPTERGRWNVCQDILSCQETATATPEKSLSTLLYELSQSYISGLLFPMRLHGNKPPETRDPPSREEFIGPETVVTPLVIEEAKCDGGKLRALALLRDNSRSVISGSINTGLIKAKLVPQPEGYIAASTHAAYILPSPLASDQEQTTLWSILARFSGMDVFSELSGENINRLGNILTLSTSEHVYFGRLEGWLEPVEEGKAHTYRVCAVARLAEFSIGKVVTFTTTRRELELPDPRFIAIHAACAKVIHTSGISLHLDRIISDWEDLPVLAEDGSSDVLSYALRSIA